MANAILVSILSMGGLSLLLGGGLAFASKKFAVDTDPRVDAVLEALPGANCGACGFPGCSGLAGAIVAGSAPVNACLVGGENVAKKIAEIMGVSDTGEVKEKKIARVLCQGGKAEARLKADYHGVKSCRAASMVNGGPKGCPYACIGFGDCAEVCPFDAITMSEDGLLPVIDEEKCTGCGLCVKECPKFVIALTPEKNEVHVRCRATLKGKDTRAVCDVGCIACKKCEKECPFDAIHVVNNVAVIDYEKCRNCMKCVEACPTKTITAAFTERKKAVIDDKCIGCTICAKNCPANAITGEVKKKHIVNQELCIGCSICEDKCPKGAITMVRNGQKANNHCASCNAAK